MGVDDRGTMSAAVCRDNTRLTTGARRGGDKSGPLPDAKLAYNLIAIQGIIISDSFSRASAVMRSTPKNGVGVLGSSRAG